MQKANIIVVLRKRLTGICYSSYHQGKTTSHTDLNYKQFDLGVCVLIVNQSSSISRPSFQVLLYDAGAWDFRNWLSLWLAVFPQLNNGRLTEK